MYRFLVNLCLVALHINSNSVEASFDYSEVLFDSSNVLDYEMPASCAGQTFCFDKGNAYPDDKVKEMLARIPLPLNGIDLSSHDGIDNPDCPSNTSFIDRPIYYIVDQNQKVRVVVQSPEQFQQIYNVKWCQREGQITYDTPHFLKGSRTLEMFKIECVNTYMDLDFYVLNDEDYHLKFELVKVEGGIPVCCRCRYAK